MADFIACVWRPGPLGVEVEHGLAALRSDLEEAGRWRLVHESPGLWIFSLAARPIRVRPFVDRPGAIVGDLFSSATDRPLGDTAPNLGHSGDLADACTRLTRQVWGRYVAVFSNVERYEGGVYRGPVGGLECVTARCGSIVIAGTRLTHAALKFLAPRLSIDWSRLAGLSSDPGGVGGAVTLKGAASLAPGVLWRWDSKGERTDLIWRPADLARASWRGGDPAPSLEHRVDSCVRAWSGQYSPIVAELSGGLDSAIVGAALTRAGAEVRKWINFHTAERAGDERPYARAVADQLGIALTEEAKPVAPFDPGRLAEACEGPRPSLNRLDAPYDDRMAELAAEAEARAIFTGQGGDILFYGMSTPLLAVDHLQRCGFGGLGSPFLVNLARRRRQSFWSLARTGLTGLMSAGSLGASAQSHPWLDGDQADLGPAKRQQLAQLVYCLRFFGPCRRTRVAELIHPLLSQPVVELCLSIPADLLVEEGRERGLVRRAFAARLPSKVIDRRSKGDLTLFYGRSVALALPQLRETLLGGALVAHGALEAQALSERLDLDRLAVEGRHTEIMTLAALDAWAGCWQARLDRVRTGRQR